MNPLIFYHDECSDGFCCAWLLSKQYPDAEFRPAKYGQKLNPREMRDRDVIMVDYSRPREEMVAIYKLAKSFLVIDHHATAERECKDLTFCQFDLNRAACQMVYDRYGPPGYKKFVDYIADRDLWKWELPDSRAINSAIRSYPYEFDAWDVLAATPLGNLVDEGKAINRYRERVIQEHVQRQWMTSIHAYRVPMVDCSSKELVSDIAGRLAEDHLFGVCCRQLSDKTWEYSLRSRNEDIDVSVIAEFFGGGGHPQAAGFKLQRPLFKVGRTNTEAGRTNA